VAQTIAPELTLLKKLVSVEMVQSKEIGILARQHRESAGRTLREVAGIMQIDQSYLSDLERGQREWHSGLVARWNLAAKELFTTDAR
jgi:transcriptional regulator with XRE-family HTH domain